MEKTIFKISLTISVAGIFILLLLSNILSPKLTEIGKINNKMIYEKVKIKGEIFNIQEKENFKIISIKGNTGKIDVVCQCKNNLKKGKQIIVQGQIQEYGQYLQISADKILSA
jgi:DNA/RNA endonuclease YhcR with UshA esterase domain